MLTTALQQRTRLSPDMRSQSMGQGFRIDNWLRIALGFIGKLQNADNLKSRPRPKNR